MPIIKNVKKVILLITTIVVCFTCIPVLAQPAGGPPPGGPTGGTDPPCWPPPCIPVDGGVSILIALGAAYGGKKAYDQLKSSRDSESNIN